MQINKRNSLDFIQLLMLEKLGSIYLNKEIKVCFIPETLINIFAPLREL